MMPILPNLPVLPAAEVVVTCQKDGEFDKISIEGGRYNEDYYPDGPVKYIAFSDGTLIMYKEDSDSKLLDLERGYAFKEVESKSKRASVVVLTDNFKWIVYGDRY